MKYADVKSILSVKAGVTQEQADKVLKALNELIEEKILEAGKITLPKFGTIEAVEVAEKSGVAFKGTARETQWTKPKHTTIRFKFSDVLKGAVEVKSNPSLAKEEVAE